MKTNRKKIVSAIIMVLIAAFPGLCAQAGATTDTPAFTNAAGTGGGFIRAGRQYFFKANGTLFFVVGHCASPDRFTTDAYCDYYFRNMAARGENVLRFLFGSSKIIPRIESSAGVPDPAFKPYLDRLLKYASRYGVYLQIGIWSWWTDYYTWFFTDPTSRQLQKETLKYLARNWGQSENIFAWEIYNEIPAFYPTTTRWAKETADYFRAQGIRQMVCASASNPTPLEAIPNEGMDFISYHAYWVPGLAYSEGTGQAALDRRALNVPLLFNPVRARFPGKPVMDTEIPGIPRSFLTKLIVNWDFSLVHLSDAAFAKSFYDVGKAYVDCGAAGSGLSWSCNPPALVGGRLNDLSDLLYEQQAAIRAYANRKLSAVRSQDPF